MARRTYYRTIRCPEEGCRESAHYEYGTQREYADHSRHLAKLPWRCFRHRNPEEVLSPDNRERVTMLTVTARDDIDGKHFFDGRSGMVSGPGFKAVAQDWPIGTQIVIAARVLTAEPS